MTFDEVWESEEELDTNPHAHSHTNTNTHKRARAHTWPRPSGEVQLQRAFVRKLPQTLSGHSATLTGLRSCCNQNSSEVPDLDPDQCLVLSAWFLYRCITCCFGSLWLSLPWTQVVWSSSWLIVMWSWTIMLVYCCCCCCWRSGWVNPVQCWSSSRTSSHTSSLLYVYSCQGNHQTHK